GYSAAEVRSQLEHRRPDAERYITPQRELADLIVRFYPPPTYNWSARDNTHLSVRITQKRALGAPDLGDAVRDAAKVARRDGTLPYLTLLESPDIADAVVLDIDGGIPGRAAAELEEALWSQMETLRILRTDEAIGTFVQNEQLMQSHTLALTQLLATYYIVQAASLTF